MLENKPKLTTQLLWLMTIGAGLVVANNYYNQPLLGMIAKELNRSEAAASKISMFTQIGYALGLLLLIPLGDMVRRKKMILIDFVFIISSLLGFALAPNLELLILFSLTIGLTSVIPQVFVPIAAQLSEPAKKEKNVALIMTGLMIGILGSRVLSGILAEVIGWREVFIVGAIIMGITMLAIYFIVPDVSSTFEGTYLQLMRSIARFALTMPDLRLAAIRGGLCFGSFSVFWSVLSFRLELSPYYAGSALVGMFGIVGIAGALGSSLAGYLSDKFNRNTIIIGSTLLVILSWVVFYFFDNYYVGLVIGILLLDLGLACLNVTNQFIVYSKLPEAANRMNTVYMVSYFVGGALGSYLSGIAWVHYGWLGVCCVGALLASISLILHIILYPKTTKQY